MRRSVATSLLLAAVLAACTPVPVQKVVGARKSSAPATPSTAPVIAPSDTGVTPGGNIVSNNTGSLIGKVKAPASLISDKGVGLVGNNGGSLVTNGGGNYRLQATVEQVPLAGVTVRLLDAAGQAVKGTNGQPLTAVTDAQGNYGFQTALPTQNLVVEVALADDKGAVRAVVPREGTGQKQVEVDLVSTLTTGYILEQFVRTQKDPLATFEKLPADVEATTRERAQAALTGGTTAVPDDLSTAKVVATVEAMRDADTSFDAQMEAVKKLLVVAGASDLGTGLKATEVTLKNVDDVEVAPDGTIYVLTTEDNRVWRVRPDGVIETAVGDRRPPDGQDLTGKLGTEASLDRPTGLTLDAAGNVLLSEARGVFRLGTDGKLTRLATRTSSEFAAGKNDEVIVGVLEPTAEYAEMGLPEFLAPKVYAYYRFRPGMVAERLCETVTDPYDDGEQTIFLRGIAWDGGNIAYLNLFHNGSGHQLTRLDLTAKTTTPDPNSPVGTVQLDGAGHVFVRQSDGTYRARHLYKSMAEKTVPAPPEHFSRLTLAPDGRAYAAKWSMVLRLEAAGAVRVAGTEGQGTGGSAGTFTFEVLSGATVTPEGVVYAIDVGKGAVYKVGADRNITSLADTGRGNSQLLRSDPAGVIYMSDGNGTGIGRFDAQGQWTSVGTTTDHIVDYAVAGDGTVYASTVSLNAERRYRIVQIKGGVETVLETGIGGGLVAVDASGVLHVVGGGLLRKRTGTSWTTVKADDRFTNAYTLGGGPNIAFDAKGRLYMTISDQNKIIRYTPSSDLFEGIAGVGTKHFGGTTTDDGINKPRTPAFDAAGNLYFADMGNRQVKRIAADGLE